MRSGKWNYDEENRRGYYRGLYWDFYLRHRERLENNPRIGFASRTLDRFSEEERRTIQRQAEEYLTKIERL